VRSDENDVEVAVVSGGPAGAAVAAHLSAAGHEVAVFERLAEPRWRACGVYSSPLTRQQLAALGLTGEQLQALIQPIPAMVVEMVDGGARCRLDYPTPHEACGVDRVRLEAALLALIRARGVRVYEGAVVRSVVLGQRRSRLAVSQASGVSNWSARVVVGADGPSSVVARAARVALATRCFRRAALTGHRAATLGEAHMIIGRGWYLGIAPVPGGRVNLGMVMAEADLRRQLQRAEPADVLATALERTATGADLIHSRSTDEVATHLPLVHRVRRAAGPGFLLVGDAAGFIDPLSGEGLHRALVSAELGAHAIDRSLAGDPSAMPDYDRHLRARFRSKDVLSWLLQLFLFQPGLARHALQRLARRTKERQQFAAALADLVPASSVIDPRFIARVLA
jgi:flavin-dependent dehydrogenase